MRAIICGIISAADYADFRIAASALSRPGNPHINEITAEDLLGDYPSITYGPPEETFAIDLLTRLGEAYSFESLPSELVEIEGIAIRVVTAAKLYEMKRNTVRLKDKADCLALNEKFHFEES